MGANYTKKKLLVCDGIKLHTKNWCSSAVDFGITAQATPISTDGIKYYFFPRSFDHFDLLLTLRINQMDAQEW